MIIRPPAVEPYSQLQKRLCGRGLRASLGREVQLGQYSTLGLKILSFKYAQWSACYGHGWDWDVTREVDATRRSTVFFQDHA
jgi:hypothetical protein